MISKKTRSPHDLEMSLSLVKMTRPLWRCKQLGVLGKHQYHHHHRLWFPLPLNYGSIWSTWLYLSISSSVELKLTESLTRSIVTKQSPNSLHFRSIQLPPLRALTTFFLLWYVTRTALLRITYYHILVTRINNCLLYISSFICYRINYHAYQANPIPALLHSKSLWQILWPRGSHPIPNIVNYVTAMRLTFQRPIP